MQGHRPEFEWDEANEQRLLDRHGVSAYEAEQCFANPRDARRYGDNMVLLGSTDGGRWLHLCYEQKPGGVVRVYHAREMNSNERRIYRRRCLR